MNLKPLFNIRNSITIEKGDIPIKQTSKLVILFKSKIINLAKTLLTKNGPNHFNRQLYLECIPLLVEIGIEENWDQMDLKLERIKYQSISLSGNIQLILAEDFRNFDDYLNVWCLFLAIGKKAGYSIENIQQHYLKLFKITPHGVVFRFDDEDNFIYDKTEKSTKIGASL